MNFKEWLQQEEAAFMEAPSAKAGFATSATGMTRGRPGANSGFAANRSQLWGPSATYGRADTMMPWNKPLPAIATGIGQSFQQSLGWQPTPVAAFEPMPKNEGILDRWGALPLQLPPPEFNMGRKNKLGLLTAIGKMLKGIEDPRIQAGAVDKGEGDSKEKERVGDDDQRVEGKFQLVNQDMLGDIEIHSQAVEFTQALLHYVHVQNLKAEGIRDNYDWQDPEVHPNITNDEWPLYEAIFRFKPASEGEWGSAKRSRADKQAAQADNLAMQDTRGMYGQGTTFGQVPDAEE